MNAGRACWLVTLFAALAGPAWAVKPQPPVRLDVVLANEPKPGEAAQVEITVRSKLDLQKLSLRCRIPHGLKLADDQKADWELDITKGQPATVRFEVVIPDQHSYKLIVRAEAKTDQGPVGAIAKLVIDLGGGEKNKIKPNVIETKDGEKLRLNPESGP